MSAEHSKNNNESRAWAQQTRLAMEELAELIPEGETFILVDDEQLGVGEVLGGRVIRPFIERQGQYWGPPPSDEVAMWELERIQQASDVRFMVFAWPAFWWLDYYVDLSHYLRSKFCVALENDRLVVFDLQQRRRFKTSDEASAKSEPLTLKVLQSAQRPSSNRRILFYGGGWPTNIGNAVIGLGAMALLRAAAPGAEIINLSGMPRWFFGDEHADNALDIASICQCDLAVFSGMSMCEEFVRVNGPTILKLRQRGVPVLLLGTGGRLYDSEEQQLFSAFLTEVKPVAFIARDQASFEAYAGVVKRSESGLDCGFFVSMWQEALAVGLSPYVVINFDSTRQPKIDSGGRQVIYAHHDCWGKIPESRKTKPNTLISDLPQDYLTLYANAECVYSDRVHACVAALAYGRKAQLFHDTPRGNLFEAVGASAIRERPVSLDPAAFEAKRASQIKTTAAIIRDCFKNT